MKRFILIAAVAMAGCADDKGDPRTFDNNDLELAVGNSAMMGCSCMFVMDMPEDYCLAWVKASPDVAKVVFNKGAKTVESSAFISWTAKAHFVDARRGCVLE